VPSGELTTLLESEPAPQPVLVAESEPAVVARPPRFPAFDGLRPSPPSPWWPCTRASSPASPLGTPPSGATPGDSNRRRRLLPHLGFLLYRPSWSPTSRPHRSRGPAPFGCGASCASCPPSGWCCSSRRTCCTPGPGSARGWTANLWHFGFAQIYSPDHVTKGISAAWSLNVEMTFYLFVPLYAALIGWRRARRSLGRSCASSSTAFLPW